MNKLDKQYTNLLQDILDNGTTKSDRTGTGTISVFGRQIRHKMSEGFPLLTTKKMPFKTIVTELIWFLRGSTNIKYLVDNNCHIWDGDCYKNWCKHYREKNDGLEPWPIEVWLERFKADDEFAKTWGELGPIYGKQWRSWEHNTGSTWEGNTHKQSSRTNTDQIANLINDLKTNPDSRRLMVNAWNVGELDQQVLPPCHYGFQVYTRELSQDERIQIYVNQYMGGIGKPAGFEDAKLTTRNIPTRAISLMWNQRSCDTFLGIPFNIASYGLLLEIIAKAVNMVPDELIGNLGDVHLYSNHIEQAKEQIGRELTHDERFEIYKNSNIGGRVLQNHITAINFKQFHFDEENIPTRTREPFPLPKLNINTEFWPTENGECGEGTIDSAAVLNGLFNDDFCKCLLEDIQLVDYQSHPAIKAPLSN
jgi:thymidylate synthase